MLTTALIAACHDKACAPPPVGTGGSRLVKNKSIPNVESSRLQESVGTIHTAMHTMEGLHKWDKPRRSLVDWGQKLKMIKAELRKRGESTNVKDCPWCSDESTFSVQSSVIFECLGKACAPPPVGTGGSISSSPATQRAAARYEKARKSGDVTAINKAAVAYGKARARDARAAAPADVKKRVAVAKRHIGTILKNTQAGPPTDKGRQKLIIDPKVHHLLLKDKMGEPSKTTGKREPMSTAEIGEILDRTHNFGELKGTQTILDKTGASAGKPRLVSKKEFDALKKQSDPESVMARSAPESDHGQLRTGNSYKLPAGGAHYGEGIYFAVGKGAVAHVERNYSAGGRNKTQEAIVDRKAIADQFFISQVQEATKKGLKLWGSKGMDPKTPKKVREAAEIIIAGAKASGLGKKLGDRGLLFDTAAIATMLGYKGYEIKNPNTSRGRYSGSYIAILDRSALTMAE